MVPLTLDYGSVQMILRDLDPGWLLPERILKKLFVKEYNVSKLWRSWKVLVMILMSDGEELPNEAVKAAKEAAELGIRIYTIGIGSRDGVPIPLTTKSGEVSYKKILMEILDDSLEEQTLQEVAM